MKRISIFFCLLAVLACRQNLQTASPDGSIVFDVCLDTAGVPQYTVSMDGKSVLGPSPVGLEAEGLDMYGGYKVRKVTRRRVDEAWKQPWGENKEMRDRHRETAVFLENPSGVRMTLRARVFDDGAGFRCEYDAPADTLRILRENTGFRFAEDGTSWSIESNFDSYECPFRKLPISGTPDANTPFTFLAGDVYGSIHEAALYDFPEMNLERVEGTEFRSRLAPLPGTEAKAVVPGAFKTPWRTVQLGRKAVDLINSSLILNLNEPSKIEDASWIKPQKYVGVWWGMHLGTQSWTMGPRHGATTENALRHIDFAAANNIQGVLFEGWNYGWDTWGGEEHFDYTRPYADFDLPRIKAHADSLGVALWLHNETGGNVPEYEAAIDTAFALYEKWGIHTVKTGYAGGMPNGYAHHSQYGVRHYQKVVEAAAAHRIAIDAHEPIKETGIRRTWPNMMTREGARGMEWNAWSAGNSPEHLCTLPFTRLLGGPMDYTPGVFDIYYEAARRNPDRKPWNGDYSRTCIKTTLARQIANWVILYSPLQMACDLIENYEGHPAFQFFRDFDADCDFSKALDGGIGEYIAVVRRAGDRYFLGAGTDSSARSLDIPLDFLESGKEYDATVYADDLSAGPTDAAPTPEDGARDRRAYRIETRAVTSGDTLHVEMAPGGGQAVSFIPR